MHASVHGHGCMRTCVCVCGCLYACMCDVWLFVPNANKSVMPGIRLWPLLTRHRQAERLINQTPSHRCDDFHTNRQQTAKVTFNRVNCQAGAGSPSRPSPLRVSIPLSLSLSLCLTIYLHFPFLSPVCCHRSI